MKAAYGRRGAWWALLCAWVFASACGSSETSCDGCIVDYYLPQTRVIPLNVEMEDTLCLTTPLGVSHPIVPGGGAVACSVVEARPVPATGCEPCGTRPGRLELTVADYRDKIRSQLGLTQYCAASDTACQAYCFCAIEQLIDDELAACETSLDDPGTADGFCYIDESIDLDSDGLPDSNPELLAACPENAQHTLRFMGATLPTAGVDLFLACPAPVYFD